MGGALYLFILSSWNKESLILVGSSEAERRSAGGNGRRGERVRTEAAVEAESEVCQIWSFIIFFVLFYQKCVSYFGGNVFNYYYILMICISKLGLINIIG